jgi:hypothetical protein
MKGDTVLWLVLALVVIAAMTTYRPILTSMLFDPTYHTGINGTAPSTTSVTNQGPAK